MDPDRSARLSTLVSPDCMAAIMSSQPSAVMGHVPLAGREGHLLPLVLQSLLPITLPSWFMPPPLLFASLGMD